MSNKGKLALCILLAIISLWGGTGMFYLVAGTWALFPTGLTFMLTFCGSVFGIAYYAFHVWGKE